MYKIYRKIKNNLLIYKNDIKTKGLYCSILLRLHKLPLPKFVLIPLINFLKPNYIMTGGFKLYLDKSDNTVSEKLLADKIWEEYESKLFKENINSGDIIIDIGAHIGYYTLIASTQAGKNGKVYAFEPDPRNFELLKKNVSINRCDNVILINKAVTTKGGNIKLYLNKQNTGDHRTYDSQDNRESIFIESVSLDDYFKNIKKINLIKIDIQGAELKALKGALNLISKNKNLKLFTEFWPMGLKLNQSSAKEYLKLLAKYSFKLLQISEETNKLTPVNSKQLLKLYPAAKTNYTNLFCIRN